MRQSDSSLSLCQQPGRSGGVDFGCEPPLMSRCKSFLLYVWRQSVKNLWLRQSGMGSQVDTVYCRGHIRDSLLLK